MPGDSTLAPAHPQRYSCDASAKPWGAVECGSSRRAALTFLTQGDGSMADTAPRRRRFRYRLSWLLVLLTLAGVFLGRQTYLAREQADAVQAILEAEGH